MLFTQLRAMMPSQRMLLTIALSSILGGAVAIGVSTRFHRLVGPFPSLQPAHDPRFVLLGRAYLPVLGKAYAAAWSKGAEGLAAGQSLSTALDVVAKAWEASRVQLFDRVLTPEFSKLIPDTKQEADVTPQERAAMAEAWRGFAMGLGR